MNLASRSGSEFSPDRVACAVLVHRRRGLAPTRARESGSCRDAAGRQTRVHGCDIFEFEGDRIKLKDTYQKVLAEVETPGRT